MSASDHGPGTTMTGVKMRNNQELLAQGALAPDDVRPFVATSERGSGQVRPS